MPSDMVYDFIITTCKINLISFHRPPAARIQKVIDISFSLDPYHFQLKQGCLVMSQIRPLFG